MKLSVILPTYEEADNIVPLVQAVKRNVAEPWELEVVVVDDDSPDATHDRVVEAFRDDPSVRAIRRTRDRGLARSIRAGIEASSGEVVLVMDTDFTHDPDAIPVALHLVEYFDLVSGSRFCAGGAMDDTPHYVASLLYNWLVRIVVRTQIQDNLGGYFAIRRDRLAQLPFDEIFFGYGDYYMRLLRFAERAGLTVIEFPALYRARTRGASKSHFVRMLATYTWALLRFQARSRRLARRWPTAAGGKGGRAPTRPAC